MPWSAWILSAKQAWSRPLFRMTAMLSLAVMIASATFFLWRVLPARQSSGQLIFHYSIYLGIDDVRTWAWIFLLPGAGMAFVCADVALAYALYRTDAFAAQGLLYVACGWSILWAAALYYLSAVNL